MRSFCRVFLLALPFLGSVACNEPASPTKQNEPVYPDSNEAFQDLLNALPAESLHAALHSLSHFKEGVFESDRHGVERVHDENPPLATKLIVAAVQDLKKRQNPPSNGTSPQSNPPSSTPPPPPPSSQQPEVIVPVPITTTNNNGQPTVLSSEIISEPTASVVVAVTQTNAQGQPTVLQETKPAVIITATNTAGSTFLTTSAVEFAPTPGEVLTKTNSQGSVFVTTYTPGGGRISKIILITYTNAAGQASVMTSYTYVEPARTSATPTEPHSRKPGLQTNAANRHKALEYAMAGGAVGGMFAFLL